MMGDVIKFKQSQPKTDMEFARGLSTYELKVIWDDMGENEVDSFTYSSDSDTYYISDEMVHEILNERGEGNYCAV